MFLQSRRRGWGIPRGAKELLGGSSWLIVGAILGQGGMLLASLAVANLVGVADFGRYALVQGTLLMMAGLAQTSFAVVIAQQVASLRMTQPRMAGEVAVFCFVVTAFISLLFSIGLFLGRHQIAIGLFRDGSLREALAMAALILPWLAAGAIQQGLFLGLERFRELVFHSLLLVPFVVGLPSGGAMASGWKGAVAGLGLAYFLRFAVAHIMLMRLFKLSGIAWRLGDLKPKLKLVSRLAVPATIASILTSVAIWGGQTLLVRGPAGASAVGLFAAAYAVKTLIMFIPNQMIMALLPSLSRMATSPYSDHRRGLLYLNLILSLAATITLSGIAILLRPYIMNSFGPGFAGGISTLSLLLIATPIEAATITLYQDMQSRGLFWKVMLFVNLPSALTVLSGAALLVPGRGADGLAIAWLFGWAVALMGTLLAMRASKSRIRSEDA